MKTDNKKVDNTVKLLACILSILGGLMNIAHNMMLLFQKQTGRTNQIMYM